MDKLIYFVILTDPTQAISEMLLDNFEQREYYDLNRYIISPQRLARMWVRRMGRISPGNFIAQANSNLILVLLENFVKDIEHFEIVVLRTETKSKVSAKVQICNCNLNR